MPVWALVFPLLLPYPKYRMRVLQFCHKCRQGCHKKHSLCEFIALAAHELRTPLAILKGYAQTLLFQQQQGRGPRLAAWQNETLQDIDEVTQELTTLTLVARL